MRIANGKPYPLGATYDGSGVNFSVFSSIAERVELCLFDEQGRETRCDLPEMTAFCWHGFVPGIRPGQEYGFRLHGPWAPDAGLRCNPSKLLLDPYAKWIQGQVDWDESIFTQHFSGPPGKRNDRDSAPYVPRSAVINPDFDWGDDKRPSTPWDMTVIYEVHVKGFTITHPEVAPELRGTYLGLTHPAIIDYLQTLGITAIELMPVQHFVHDMYLLERGLRNYWGYNTIGFFAPHSDYATGSRCASCQVREFKQMVKNFHAAGIEVILDVVYGHTAEGNHLGPVLSFKGLDNAAYYRLDEVNPHYYKDYTGTGNSLNMRHPQVLQFLMDSLRYWITEMHVDGFRFDLASTLARGKHDVDRLSGFFDVIQQDPIVSQVKLIAEPWDVFPDGYQVGRFPPLWSEWNGQFRDSVRDYWRGNGALRDFSYRLCGSPDLYEPDRRRPTASINFVACHDGFTLRDLVSYNNKHNAANGECECDGENDNRSWNYGVEGMTSNEAINTVRDRQVRNFFATLMLSQGVPMILAGDEIGRTQRGNNNAYCQDNDISWIDWDDKNEDLFAFVAGVIALRRRHPVFRRRHFGWDQIRWRRNDGELMTAHDWNTPWAKAIAMFIAGAVDCLSEFDMYVAFNAHSSPLDFTIPMALGPFRRVLLDTSERAIYPVSCAAGITFSVDALSILVLAR